MLLVVRLLRSITCGKDQEAQTIKIRYLLDNLYSKGLEQLEARVLGKAY